ncbi:hypothetical protein [Crateriforma conspicua]|uniref:hypothetical protein n=1 Tax=Crateriforma conspicua TaxID=2527996 RepID=UPI0011B49A9F|nr:hypothetical protein [Crateriforma conspicua]
MNEQRRPIHVADLLWLGAFVAFVLAFAVPAYRFASDANQNVASIPYGFLGPVCMLATIGVLGLPILHLLLGVALVRSRGSFVTRMIAIAILLNAIPSGFASASIGRACAMQMAG